MDNLILIVILVFAGIIIAGFLFYRSSVRAKITGPAGTGLEFEGKAREPAPPPPAPAAPVPPVPGVSAKGITAGRDADLHDRTGRGVDAERVRAERDVDISAEPPPSDPKAPPPA